METKETFLKIEFCGDKTNVQIKGDMYDLITAMANGILEDKTLQAIVIAGLAGACNVRPELKDKFNQMTEMIVMKQKQV